MNEQTAIPGDLPELPPSQQVECPKCGCEGATISYKLFRMIYDCGNDDVVRALSPMPHLTCSTCDTVEEPMVEKEEFESQMEELMPRLKARIASAKAHDAAEAAVAQKAYDDAMARAREASRAAFKGQTRLRRGLLRDVYNVALYTALSVGMGISLKGKHDVFSVVLVFFTAAFVVFSLWMIHFKTKMFLGVLQEIGKEPEKDETDGESDKNPPCDSGS